MKKAWVLSNQLSAQQRLWSDWADAQADLSLRWAHMPFCWFCHEVVQIYTCVLNTGHKFKTQFPKVKTDSSKLTVMCSSYDLFPCQFHRKDVCTTPHTYHNKSSRCGHWVGLFQMWMFSPGCSSSQSYLSCLAGTHRYWLAQSYRQPSLWNQGQAWQNLHKNNFLLQVTYV